MLKSILDNKSLARVDEVAEYYRKSEKTIRRWIKNGDLPAYRLKSGGILIPTTALKNVIRLDRGCYERE